MKSFLRIVLIGVQTLCCLCANAINDKTVRLFQNEEIVEAKYNAFCRDVDGFVWIGTDGGLYRFDGNQSDHYSYNELDEGSLSDNRVQKLFIDSKGRLWVGTVNGLNYFDKNALRFIRVKLPGMELNGFISAITEVTDGRIVFMVGGVGIFAIDADKIHDSAVAVTFKSGVHNEAELTTLLNLGPEGLILTSRCGTISLLSPDRRLTELGTLGENINYLTVENSGSIIMTSQYRIYRYNPADRTFASIGIDGGEHIKITGIHGGHGVTFLATSGRGLWEIAEGSMMAKRSERFYSPILDLRTLKIGSVFRDYDGNLWMGCNHTGVVLVPAKKMPFKSVKLDKIIPGQDGEIASIELVGNRIVAGLTTGKILVTDTSWKLARCIDIPGQGIVTSIVSDGAGSVLAGVVHGGIYRIDIESGTVRQLTPIERQHPGILLSVTENGDVIGAVSEVGILRFDRATGEKKWFYPEDNSPTLTSYYYSGICHASDDKVWVGCYSGLSCYDGKSGQLTPVDQAPFINVTIHSICDNYDGSVMLATSKGLLRYEPGKGVVRKYTVLDGLADNDARTVVMDKHGGLWVGTIKGISYLSREDASIQSFSSNLGLTEKSYTFSTPMRNGSMLVMGAPEGLTTFNPDSISPKTFSGAVKVSGIFLNGSRVTPATLGEKSRPIIEGDEIFPSALHLSFKDKSLMLRLSTVDFRNSARVRYEWQLEGDGDTWYSTQLGENLLYLPPLDPGKHVLRIRGWEDNVCSDVSEMLLDISKQWYMDEMAQAGYILAGLLILGLLYKVFESRREEKLNEEKIKYFMDISHEIRTPITLLLNPVEALLKQDQTPKMTSQLLTMRRNAQRVLNLADQLLDIRKMEKGKMRLVYEPTELRSFISELVDMFRPQAEAKGLTIEFKCPLEKLDASADRNNLDKILVNLISNAIKYTPTGGSVTVELSTTTGADGGECYEVKVTDTGIGLDNKIVEHLFTRFYRDRERHHSYVSGFGIGLDLCLRLVKLHGGTIAGRNREDGTKGSVFTIVMPLHPGEAAEAPAVAETPEEKATIRAGRQDMLNNSMTVAPAEQPSAPKGATRYNIMVVDDDAELREYIRGNLGASYKVKTYASGAEIMKTIAEKQPDLIISDIRMDGMDGFELLKSVKSNFATHHIPVVLMSASGDADSRTKGWKCGADGFLSKPFSIEELAGMISGLISTRQKLKGKFSGSLDSSDKIASPKLKGINDNLMKSVDKYINDNISESDFNVDTLSEAVGISRSQLHRKLKEIVGVSPSDYIRNIKLQKACELLRDTDVDVAQVAYSLGFNAQSHFSTLFKKYTGLTPSEYRSRESQARNNA